VIFGKKTVEVKSRSIEQRNIEISEGSFWGVEILKLIVAKVFESFCRCLDIASYDADLCSIKGNVSFLSDLNLLKT
jgi:hypothetical protein